ncbi:MAG: hypothetical protein QW514_05140 [Thermoprotei archaeon]
MPRFVFPYTLDEVQRRTEYLKILCDLMSEIKPILVEAKKMHKLSKNPNLLRAGLSLILLPEPFTSVVGIPLVAYSLSKRSTVNLGEELSSSYTQVWRALSCF